MSKRAKIIYADDDTEGIGTLLKLRAPALFIGLVLGIGISFIISRFEEVLAQNVQAAFFLPFVVYIANAVGMQTETIYTSDLRTGHSRFRNYLAKEPVLGIFFGIVFGAISGVVVFWWLADEALAWAVALSTFIAIVVAPLVALLISQGVQFFKQDPAAEAGPIVTVIQDMISVIIYGVVCSLVLLY